jgi:cobalt-zinc-cadmium efflux system membrane fusion protein
MGLMTHYSGGTLRQVSERLLRHVSSLPRRRMIAAGAACALVVLGAGAVAFTVYEHPQGGMYEADVSSRARLPSTRYRPTDFEWTNLVVESVEQRSFRPEQVTEGKISVDDNRSTPVFSPYSGRVTTLLVKAGDTVEKGQPLYVIEATDTVQALNEFMTASAGSAKARAALTWAQSVEQRNRALFDGRAVPLRDLQQSQSELTTAQNDARSAEAALESARNRLRHFGRNDEEIAEFERSGKISPETVIPAPIAGTIVARKIGPGQYVSASNGDPAFVIGDLSTVWLTIYVRETAAAKVAVGQNFSFTAAALPGRTFDGTVEYVAAGIDPSTRRMMVRASVPNADGMLRPEMLATITIMAKDEAPSPAVPRESVVSDGDQMRVWVVCNDRSIELRPIRTGLASGRMVQVLEGLAPGERIIARGSLFIDRAPAGS